MPFVIDDIAVAATEISEVAAEMGEAAAETSEIAGAVTGPSEIIGDDISEGALVNEKAKDVGEASELSVPESSKIIGDGIGEGGPVNETAKDARKASELSIPESSEIVRDGMCESSIDESIHLDEHTMDRIQTYVENINNDLDSETLKNYQFDSLRTINTRNEGLEGQNHPETGVPYERKVVKTDTGEEVEGVFPQFESKMDVQLPEELEQASDNKQFAECNKQLKEKCDNDPEFRKQFTDDQSDDINNGQTPEGYTWHHSEEKGKMQLVKYDIHMKTGHTGGRSIWGGGTVNR